MLTLPGDIVVDILSRLPVKSLRRFRAASKPWCALIDSPDFIKMHLNRSIKHRTNLSLIFRGCYLYSSELYALGRAVELDHPLKADDCGTEVLGSCNGLLALYNGEDEIMIWNPSTRQHHMVPFTPTEYPERDYCCVQFIVYGFGHDLVNDDYKLVRMVQFYGDDDDSFDSEVKVFSLKSNSWTRIQDFPYYLCYKRGYGVLASGALHWVVSRKAESDVSKLIVAFDIGLEEYREVPQPEYSDGDFYMNVEEFEGWLCIICTYHQVRVDIWVMKEYGVKESWTKLFSVPQPEVIPCYESVKPLVYSKNGREILLDQGNEKFLWYDPEKKRVRNIQIRGVRYSVETYVCWGSLVPLSGYNGTEEQQQRAREKKKKRKNRERDTYLSEGFNLTL